MASVGTIKIPFEVVTAGEWELKCWGRTRCLTERPHYQLHELQVIAGFCSIHYHRKRANRFIVASGSIAVRQWFWKNELPDHILVAGDELDVPSLVVHQFRVIKPGTVYEEYWPDRGEVIHTSDIVRLQVGGLRDVELPDLEDAKL